MSTPPGRYPTPRSRVALIASGVIGVIALSWLAWVIWDQSTPAVTSGIEGFEVLGTHETRAAFTVTRNDDQVPARCLLRAFGADHTTVGEVNVEVPRGVERQRLETVIRTERRATSVELIGCTAEGQRSAR